MLPILEILGENFSLLIANFVPRLFSSLATPAGVGYEVRLADSKCDLPALSIIRSEIISWKGSTLHRNTSGSL